MHINDQSVLTKVRNIMMYSKFSNWFVSWIVNRQVSKVCSPAKNCMQYAEAAIVFFVSSPFYTFRPSPVRLGNVMVTLWMFPGSFSCTITHAQGESNLCLIEQPGGVARIIFISRSFDLRVLHHSTLSHFQLSLIQPPRKSRCCSLHPIFWICLSSSRTWSCSSWI